jgi:hypothetical protein
VIVLFFANRLPFSKPVLKRLEGYEIAPSGYACGECPALAMEFEHITIMIFVRINFESLIDVVAPVDLWATSVAKLGDSDHISRDFGVIVDPHPKVLGIEEGVLMPS